MFPAFSVISSEAEAQFEGGGTTVKGKMSVMAAPGPIPPSPKFELMKPAGDVELLGVRGVHVPAQVLAFAVAAVTPRKAAPAANEHNNFSITVPRVVGTSYAGLLKRYPKSRLAVKW